MNKIEVKKKLAIIAKKKLNKANLEIASLIRLNEFGDCGVRIPELLALGNIFERVDALYLSMNRIINREK